MKNILVLVHDDSGQESRLQAALDVTRALNGHLSCLDVAIMPETAFDRSLDAERATEADNRHKVTQRLLNEGVPWDWIDAEDYIDTAVINASDLADLIVVNGEFAGGLSVKSGKPVLAVPTHLRSFDVAGAALVAWDGSDPAEAAVKAAIPILLIAQGVTVYEVDDDSIGVPAEEVAAYLSRHGVHAEIIRDQASSNEVDDLLLGKAESGEFSYGVMGAYSRPRPVEALFGGVTRRMLKDCPIPLILAR